MQRPVWPRLALALFTTVLVGNDVSGQAWLPPKGEGSIGLTFVSGDVDRHLFSSRFIGGVDYGTRELDLGKVDSQTEVLNVSYGITQRFAVSADAAYVSARYTGPLPENPELDNGRWNRSMQDLRVLFRYQAYRGRVVVTPFGGAVVPLEGYEHFGHAAVGRHLNEYPIGVSLGVPFGGRRTKAYILSNYAYSFVEKIEGHDTDRSNASLEVGFFPTRNLVLRAFGGWQNTHGGIDWATDIHDLGDFHVHDVAAANDAWSAGIGVAYSINPSVDVFGGGNWILSGRNTHDLTTINVGVAWNFGRSVTGRRKIGGKEGPERASAEEDRQLARVVSKARPGRGF